MSKEEVTQIRVNNQSVGIVGLKEIMEETAEQYLHKSDAEVQEALVGRVEPHGQRQRRDPHDKTGNHRMLVTILSYHISSLPATTSMSSSTAAAKPS